MCSNTVCACSFFNFNFPKRVCGSRLGIFAVGLCKLCYVGRSAEFKSSSGNMYLRVLGIFMPQGKWDQSILCWFKTITGCYPIDITLARYLWTNAYFTNDISAWFRSCWLSPMEKLHKFDKCGSLRFSKFNISDLFIVKRNLV